MKKLTLTLFIFLGLHPLIKAQNVLDMQSWTVGTGTTGAFNQNGKTIENERIWGEAPQGQRAVLWEAKPEGNSDDDGGFNHRSFAIDHTKMYRFSIWLKKTNSTDGISYFGTENVNDLNGGSHWNPYFWYGDLPELNKWYLLVAYVHGSGDISAVNYGGIYDGSNGAKVANTIDFQFPVGAATTYIRSYLYYDPNVNDRQYFYAPRVEVVNGEEPSIENLLSLSRTGVKESLAISFQDVTAVGNTTTNNIGIGTASPRALLDVAKYVSSGSLGTVLSRMPEDDVTGTGTYLGVKSYETQFTSYNGKTFALEHSFYGQTNSSISFYRGGDRQGGFIAFCTNNNTEKMRIDPWGNVGIGLTNPTEMLTVNGKVKAKEIKVDGAGAPDYVFEDSYKVATLNELESYIKANKHLPEVPSAKEFERDGIAIGEMNKLLLKKIEELTLHLIEKDKQYNGLLGDVKKQNERIRLLEKKLDKQ